VHTHLHSVTKNIDLQDSAYTLKFYNTEFNLKGERAGFTLEKWTLHDLWVHLIYSLWLILGGKISNRNRIET